MKKQLFFLLTCAASLFADKAPVFYTEEMRELHLSGYTDEEREAIEKDLLVVRSVCLSDVTKSNRSRPVYIATPGSPGARKSTILERFLQCSPEYGKIAYIDPDPRTLKYMVHTYHSRSLSPLALAANASYGISQKNAYEKWRAASNYIAQTLLEESFANRYNIAHGGTKTDDYINIFFPKIKAAGYDIVFLLCSCEDAFRYQAIQYRNNEQKFYQSTPEDAVSKGKMFPRRMSAYFTFADELYLFWSDEMNQPERRAAHFVNGKMSILDQDAYRKFVQKYQNDRANLKKEGIDIPSWDAVIALYVKE